MGFKKIIDTTPCDCLLDTNSNTTDLFVRKVRKSSDLKDPDFRNHIEKGKTPGNATCEQICGYYGVSIEIWNDSSRNILLEKYKYTAAISPKAKNDLCVVRFKESNGVVKYTPNQQIYNEYHYDFYKDDSFCVADLELIKMIVLNSI